MPFVKNRASGMQIEPIKGVPHGSFLQLGMLISEHIPHDVHAFLLQMPCRHALRAKISM